MLDTLQTITLKNGTKNINSINPNGEDIKDDTQEDDAQEPISQSIALLGGSNDEKFRNLIGNKETSKYCVN